MQSTDNAPAARFRNRPLAERKQRLERLASKNPEKIPIIFEKHRNSKMTAGAEDSKFISTRNIKLGEFTKQLRDMWKLKEDTSLFFSCGDRTVLKADVLIGDLYDQYKEEDGYLYIQYREVETFGNS